VGRWMGGFMGRGSRGARGARGAGLGVFWVEFMIIIG
jgi:hypothetical protein